MASIKPSRFSLERGTLSWPEQQFPLHPSPILENRALFSRAMRPFMCSPGANPGRTAMDMLDIGRPDIDWVGLARAFGVEAAKAENMK
jgi:hypothetical protein